jgi:hypothetical protein
MTFFNSPFKYFIFQYLRLQKEMHITWPHILGERVSLYFVNFDVSRPCEDWIVMLA